MKTNRSFLVAVVSACWFCAAAVGQQPNAPLYAPPPPIPGNGDVAIVKAPEPAPDSGLSEWIRYEGDAPAIRRDCCQGNAHVFTPLYTELYLRAGPAVPVGGEFLNRVLKDGWTIEGGARALFFNQDLNKAWTVDAHIVNTHESGGRNDDIKFPLTIFNNGTPTAVAGGVNVQSVNRTMVGLGVGREWYLVGCANSDGCRWRTGVDVGGRYGSMDLTPVQSRHVTDVITGAYAAIHTDLEVPTRYGVFFAGLRAEYCFIWNDVLQQPSNMADMSFLFTVGIKF